MVGWRQRTHGVGRAGLSCEEEGLTAATTKVYGPAFATATGFWHPLLSAEALKGC